MTERRFPTDVGDAGRGVAALSAGLTGRYVVERELGRGGMATVYLARDVRHKRPVALKVLDLELSQSLGTERFLREIELAASLQHPHVVPLFDSGEAAGLLYYVMPFVDGESLRARLTREGRLSIDAVVGVLRDVAKALAYAHTHAVIHRDIKPDNVLLSGGTAVVTDFGIAKALAAARTQVDGATLTEHGTTIGTPAYMAPEQAAGDPAIDHRADIYSLGCMAYELLAGQSPFHGRPSARMVLAQMTEAPPPLSQARPDVPAGLEQLVMRCLQKDPAQRPQSAAEIAQTLDRIARGGEPAEARTLREHASVRRKGLVLYVAASLVGAILARASIIAFGLPDWVFTGAVAVALLGLPVVAFAWFGGSPRVTWRRVWIGGASVAVAFVVVVVAFMLLRAFGIGPAGSLLAAGKLADREPVIVTDFQSSDTSLATLVTEAVRISLGQSRVVSVVPPVAVVATLRRMQRPPSSRIDFALAREIAQRDGVRAIVDGAIRSIGGGYVVSIRLLSADSASEFVAFQEAADNPRELLDAIDKLTRRLRGRVGESLRAVRASPALEQVTTPSLEALRVYAEAARMIEAGGTLSDGVERLREAVRLDTAFAMAYRKLGVTLAMLGMPQAVIDSAIERAYYFRDRLTERERLLTVATYYSPGPGRDRRRAVRAYEAWLASYPSDGGALNNLGAILLDRRDFAAAASVLKRAIESGRPSAQHYTNLVWALYNAGNVEDAERYAEEGRRRFPEATFLLLSAPHFLYGRGQLDSVEMALTEQAKSQDVVRRLNGAGGLASYALLRGRLDEARRHAAQAKRISETLGGSPSAPLRDSLELSWIDLRFREDTARAKRRIERTPLASELRALPFEERPYIDLATFFATAGDARRARALLDQHDAAVPDSVTRRLAEPARHAVLGAIALAERRYADGIRELWTSDTTYDGPDGNCSICVLDDVGKAWEGAGVPDSAIFYWEKFLNTPYFGRLNVDATDRASIVYRLGRLYESKGDVTNAVRRYREFVMLWSKADPPLQAKVTDARWRSSHLADVERTR